MPAFTDRLADGWRRAAGALPLALVPLLLSLLQIDNVSKVATFRGVRFGLRLGIPSPVVSLWQFVSVPKQGATVETGLPVPLSHEPSLLPAVGVVAVVLVVAPLYAAFTAALTAGYLGSVKQALATGEYEFGAAVRRHFLPLFVYELLHLVLGLALALPFLVFGLSGFGVGAIALVVLAIPVLLALNYVFYAAPFLVVLRDTGLLPALRGSYVLAVEGGPYLRFAAAYCGTVVGLSLVATPVVVGLGIVGVVLGAVAVAPFSLALAFATMRFVADVDPRSPDFGPWPGASPSTGIGAVGTDD